jgi:Ca2+-binding RTX toxin-like protein
MAFPAVIALSTLDGTNGFRVDGIDSRDSSGHSVASAGDVNGDGIDDLIIGAFGARAGGDSEAGEIYVVFGTRSGFSSSLSLASLNGTNGFRIDGIDVRDFAGFSVAGAGDVNGDGLDDIIIGAYGADPGGDSLAGESYVVFGSGSGFAASIDLAGLNGSNGFRLDGIDAYDRSGRSVAGAGDVNGDGFDDIIIGAYGGDPGGDSYAGETYVVFGTGSAFAASIDLGSLNGSNGFRLDGISSIDLSGFSVAGAGDINGDGFDDIIVGAFGVDRGGQLDFGASYVVFGTGSGFAASIDLASLNGTTGFRIDGIDPADNSGRSVASAGDVNGDGFDDLIIGARGADPGGDSFAGESYVVFGKAGGFTATFDLASLNGSNGFRIDGVNIDDFSGSSVASAGDINGDGFADLIVGAFGADLNGNFTVGSSYVIFGKASGFAASLDLASLNGTTGFRIDGIDQYDQSGWSVASAGDVNGDGYDDIVIGANYAANYAGESYVIFGRTTNQTEGGAGADTLTGGTGNDLLNGFAGNDVLDGGAGADRMRGGANNDIYIVDNAGDVVEELTGEGTDRVETALASYTLPDHVENLEYTGAGAFSGTGNGSANSIVGGGMGDMLSGMDGDDTLGGEAGNDILNGGNGSDRLFGGTGADTMNGEAGNDRMIVDNHGDVANGGDGIDTVEFSAVDLNYLVTGDVEIVRNISGGDLFVTLNALANTYGGGIGIDRVRAGDGQDSVYGRGGDDTLQGEGGNDYLFGQEGEDGLSGGDGNDLLYGGADNDTIFAGTGNDTLYGEGGSDLLTGSTGVDQLFGGAGADVFEFFSGDSGTTLATADRIRDFSSAQGDRIQLDGIDAIAGGADDAFSFIGAGAFTGVAGQLRAEVVGNETRISGDTNGDGVADFLIRLDGVHMLTGADFLL